MSTWSIYGREKERWDADSVDGGLSSIDVLLHWLLTPGSLRRWLEREEPAIELAKEVHAALLEQSIKHRTPSGIARRINQLLAQFREADGWLKRRGVNSIDDNHSVKQQVLRLCPYFRELAPVLGRAPTLIPKKRNWRNQDERAFKMKRSYGTETQRLISAKRGAVSELDGPPKRVQLYWPQQVNTTAFKPMSLLKAEERQREELLKLELQMKRDQAICAELQPFKERGAALVKVDYDDEASLKEALGGFEVVFCALQAFAHASQFAVARAAKAAGAQLFVPTEFGMPDEDGPNVTKQKVRDLLKELELPYALFHSGLWAEYLPFFPGYNFKDGVMTVIGDGTEKISIVARSDLSRFIAHVLLTAPKSSLEWARFSVESDRMSPKEIAALAEKKLGRKIEFKLVDYEETKKKYETDAMAYIMTRIGDGRLVSGTVEEAQATVSTFFPDWNPTRYEMFIA
ncbi:hypothetical protein PHYBOEH_006223 [Phytophthora boehmeriae]|uniref:NmrA-like domain-containing protein n=1 Tax=Phytophthora boehmeriae TaxID=109152 RepID=A0A8T1WKG7_9STRA|nr:hypothetical protein PHYBOEH_006223 [Phytophthora boehmeriae]